MANYDLTALALQGVCPGNEVLYDDLGFPSLMVKIPKLTYAQLGMGESTAVHPAFIVNGQEVDEIYISKFQNIVQNNRAYSVGGVDPKTSINFDTARQVCENKGAGWHLMTRMEWGLLVRWCQNNGVMPLGNNNFGKHSTEKSYKAIPSYKGEDGGKYQTLRIATGTGPLTWYHDQTPGGIADLCGNVWEWTGGLRTVYGEVQVLANNNGSDYLNSQGVDSTEWKAIRASDGELITPNGSGTTSGSVKMDYINSKLTYSTTITKVMTEAAWPSFANIVCDATIGENAKLLLQNLGMLMYGDSAELFSANTCGFLNSEAECCFSSGGHWHGAAFGLPSFSGNGGRSLAAGGIGFRSAYIKLPTA